LFIETNYAQDKETREQYTEFLADFEEFLVQRHTDMNFQPTVKWTIDIAKTLSIDREMERTGMRQEIMLFPHESYSPIIEPVRVAIPNESHEFVEEYDFDNLEDEIVPIQRSYPNNLSKEEIAEYIAKEDSLFKAIQDSALFFNEQGLFLHTLLKDFPLDTLVLQYVAIREETNGISPIILTQGYTKSLESGADVDAIRNLIAVDLYYELVKLVIKEESKKTTR
jgi:hypothetical protein